MAKFDFTTYFEANTRRLEISHRGGGIEIDAAEYLQIPFARMTAYQNYLGGGMTGSVQSDMNGNIRACKNKAKLARADKLADALKRYFYALSNDVVAEYDEYAASDSYEAQQHRSGSAY